MNKHLEQIIALSDFDNKITAFDPKIDNEKAKIQIFVESANEINSNIEKTNKEISEVLSKKLKTEAHLKELKQKLEENAKKTNSVTNEKEAKALQLEEEIAKEQIEHANDEIGRFETLIESKQEIIKTSVAQLKEEQNNISEIRSTVDVIIEELENGRNLVSEQRATLVAEIDGKILTFYEKIKRWAGNSAVVPVKKQACYGCYMKINDKAYSDIIKAESIATCPHCGRIIFKPTDEE